MRHLARVHSAAAHGGAGGEELTRFCTHCARLFDAGAPSSGNPNRGRVCARCGLGVVLTCSSETLGTEGAAFLVVPADLRVSAASQPAEDLFGVPDGCFGRPLMSLLTSPAGIEEMARTVVAAASGKFAPARIPVEAASAKLPVAALEARVGGCGNPPAALVVVDVGTA